MVDGGDKRLVKVADALTQVLSSGRDVAVDGTFLQKPHGLRAMNAKVEILTVAFILIDDADHVAVVVDDRTAAIAGANGGISLDLAPTAGMFANGADDAL